MIFATQKFRYVEKVKQNRGNKSNYTYPSITALSIPYVSTISGSTFPTFFKLLKGVFMMINNIISCEFNIDTACVEVRLTDGSMVSIDCIAVEKEYANNMYETSELDYLIYNEPMSYVRLLLSDKMEEYLRNNTDYTLLSDMR